MSKFIALLVVCFISLQTVARAEIDECELVFLSPRYLKAEYSRELDAAVSSQPALKRTYLQIKARLQRNRVLNECLKSGGCSNAQIALAVKDAIEASSLSPNAKGYGFLIGGMIASASVLAGITTWFNPQVEFLPMMVSFTLGQASIFTTNILSSFSEPISTRIRRFSYALKERGKGESEPTQAESALERMADTTNVAYTLREQHAADRVFSLLVPLQTSFQAAAAAHESGRRPVVVAQIAAAAMNGYHYFRDVNPSELAIKNAIYASFLVLVENPSSLKADAMALIRKRTETWSTDAEDYYQRALDAWLTDP